MPGTSATASDALQQSGLSKIRNRAMRPAENASHAEGGCPSAQHRLTLELPALQFLNPPR
jgi:hypothetical protein